MTINLPLDQDVYTNATTVTDHPAIIMSGNDVRLINTEFGRLLSNSASQGAVLVTGVGSHIENLNGGVIQSYLGMASSLAVLGSSGNDEVINGGAIYGTVDLGAGNDRIQQIGAPSVSSAFLLGQGDDSFELNVSNRPTVAGFHADGGSGFDTLTLTGQFGALYADVSGFEALQINAPIGDPTLGYANNLDGLSGFSQISIAAGSVARFSNSYNPLVDLSVSGGTTDISSGSLFKSLTGSSNQEFVSVGGTGHMTGNVDLGGGDDTYFIFASSNSVPSASVDGGAGRDRLTLATSSVFALDMSTYAGFEDIGDGGNVRYTDLSISHADNLLSIDFRYRAVSIQSSYSPDAYLNATSGQVTLSHSSVVGRYGFQTAFGGLGTGSYATEPNADPSTNTTVINHGTILGQVDLFWGDDVYDGSDGTTGGTIYGFAGNDTLKGGTEANTIYGGYGADSLYGYAGDDFLFGDQGTDRLIGGAGRDRLSGGDGVDTFEGTSTDLNGDTITDLSRGDRIHIVDMNASAFGSQPPSYSGGMLSWAGNSITISNHASGYFKVSSDGAGGAYLDITNRIAAPNDFTGDGKSDLLWLHNNGTVATWLTGVSGFSGGISAAASGGWALAGSDDFNGDGRADLIWRHANGTFGTWISNGNGFDGGTTGGISTDWKLAGTGDFNGDGQSDLLWRHTNGNFGTWSSTGTNFTGGIAGGLDTAWTITGIGDFNGDGKDDILWRHTSGTFGVWNSTGQAFVGGPAGGIGTDWSVAGVADFNGDGKDDILWRHPSGTFGVWNSTGTDFAGGIAGGLSPDWTIAEIGDYNGDGKADILWQNTGSGAFGEWLNTGDGFAAGSAGGLGTDWHLF